MIVNSKPGGLTFPLRFPSVLQSDITPPLKMAPGNADTRWRRRGDLTRREAWSWDVSSPRRDVMSPVRDYSCRWSVSRLKGWFRGLHGAFRDRSETRVGASGGGGAGCVCSRWMDAFFSPVFNFHDPLGNNVWTEKKLSILLLVCLLTLIILDITAAGVWGEETHRWWKYWWPWSQRSRATQTSQGPFGLSPNSPKKISF